MMVSSGGSNDLVHHTDNLASGAQPECTEGRGVRVHLCGGDRKTLERAASTPDGL